MAEAVIQILELVQVNEQQCPRGAVSLRLGQLPRQLLLAPAPVEQVGQGALIYLRQEGRGIGLSNKLRAYKLQEQGLNTVDANIKLGFVPDRRDYGIGAQICRDLGLRNIRILTNNPKKISRLEVYGIKIVEQIPLKAAPSEHNIDYLRAKKYRLGHMLDEDL